MEEKLSSKQVIFLISTFILGSSIILGTNADTGQDSWITLFTSIAMAFPLILIYGRITKLNPGESLFDMSEKLFGKIFGRIIIVLMTWYAIHLGAIVLCNFTKYIRITSLVNTPEIMVAIVLLISAFYMGKSKISTAGKWGTVILIFMILMVIFTIIISLSSIHTNHILPIMNHSFGEMLGSSIKNFSFPLAETVLFLCLGNFIKKEDSPYKIYIYGILLGSFILLVVFLRNLTVLGVDMMTSSYFPSFVAARVVGLDDFLTRVEGIITINFMLSGITKITICLIAASKGIAKLLNIQNYKDLVTPTGLIILALGSILYSSVMEMFDFITVYPLYAFPFQVIIPLIIWIASEIKARRLKVVK